MHKENKDMICFSVEVTEEQGRLPEKIYAKIVKHRKSYVVDGLVSTFAVNKELYQEMGGSVEGISAYLADECLLSSPVTICVLS